MAYKNFSNLSHKIVQLKNSPNLQYQSHHSYLPCSYLFFNTPMWGLLSFSPTMHYVHMYNEGINVLEAMRQTSPQCTYRVLPLLECLDTTLYVSLHWPIDEYESKTRVHICKVSEERYHGALKSCLVSSHPTHRGKGLTTFICYLTATPNYRICVLPPPPPGGGRSGNETTVKAPGHRKWCECTYPSR